jgi:hypothetical protein
MTILVKVIHTLLPSVENRVACIAIVDEKPYILN